MNPTALIADDEPLLREILEARLAAAWPELQIVAQARNGRQAVELFEQHQPAICFLDVHMPGLSGVEVARQVGKRAHLVFVTAFDQYALEAFQHGVLDYLVKPVTAARLTETVERLKARLQQAQPAVHSDVLLTQLAARLKLDQPKPLDWIRATVGGSLRMIPIADIDYLKSDTKYTLVAYRDEGQPAEALIRTPLKDLLAQLDSQTFWQIHRGTVVRATAINRVVRDDSGKLALTLHGSPDKLAVSRLYSHLFKAM